MDGQTFDVDNGHVAIAAITSCTNTSNPSVMIGAGLLAKKAVERGLVSKPWVKTTLAPGSKVVTDYYETYNRENVKLVDISNNLGDGKSLVTHPATTTHSEMSEEELARYGVGQDLVRVSVGIEHWRDLLNEFQGALDAL